MQRTIAILLVIFLSASLVGGQDEPNPEQLKKMYQDALANLKAAQDRKNALAMENEKLTAQIASLHKQLQEVRAKQAEFAEKTYELRALHAAWQIFIDHYPLLKARWNYFLENDYLSPAPSSGHTFMDPQWPLSAVK